MSFVNSLIDQVVGYRAGFVVAAVEVEVDDDLLQVVVQPLRRGRVDLLPILQQQHLLVGQLLVQLQVGRAQVVVHHLVARLDDTREHLLLRSLGRVEHQVLMHHA